MKRRRSKYLPTMAASVLLFEFVAFPHSTAASSIHLLDNNAGVVREAKHLNNPISLPQEEYAAQQASDAPAEIVSPQPLPQTESLALRARYTVVITAYSSTVDQTDSDPWTTASGTRVRDGIIAANFLTFGTRVRIPTLFSDKIFYVTDRMHERFSDRVDIWMQTREEALQFGVRVATIEVYE
ncbi:MAG: hypothetical protein AB1352_02595 [Patescibacteria group bacterium]